MQTRFIVLLLIVSAFALASCGGSGTSGESPTGGHPESRSLPTNITPPEGAAPIAGATAIAAGGYHSCALMADASILCWGGGDNGQLGDGMMTDRAVAASVAGLTGRTLQIAAGFFHTCAILEGGSLLCWGWNDKGTVGDGTRQSPRAQPTTVTGLQSGVTAVTAGREHTCAIANGSVRCWGDNSFGQLGDGSEERVQPAPVPVAGLRGAPVAIGAGWYHTCALTDQRAVECWGTNQYGELGNGEAGNARIATPVAVAGLDGDVTALAVGGGHSCVLTAAGTVRCWGHNNYGQLGDGTTTDRSTPVDVVGLPGDVVAIAAGTGHTCVLTRPGSVYCWGHDWYGEVGDGTSGEGNVITRPTPVSGLTSRVTALALGRFHTCALIESGAVQCWGRNAFGELGDGTRAQRLAPVPALALPK